VTALPQEYAPPAGLFKDRVVLITGAGAGLGRALALACARAGATTVLAGRTVSKLEAVYDAIKAQGLPEPALYPLNLAGATWADYEQLAATVEREFGALHGLAHCAAYFKGYTPLAEIEPRDWVEALQVNLTAAFALTRHCLPLLDQSGDASVVFVADDCGRRGKAYAGAYGVSKFALEGLMQAWAQELEGAGRVRVNSIDPGPLDTALRRKGFANPAGAQDPAAAAVSLLWLLGPDSRPASGEAFSRRR
jgi:NAD(P)-dependent dehydrogenase (short-subunit alcohol dehydrogenase family)